MICIEYDMSMSLRPKRASSHRKFTYHFINICNYNESPSLDMAHACLSGVRHGG
jgi:hypothetical protein